MIITINKAVYKAFGYYLESDIALPELQEVGDHNAEVDISVQIKDLTETWSELSTPPRKLVVQENLVMFEISETAIFSVVGGRDIFVSPAIGADVDKIRLYLLGTCMGAILLQRKVLPMHGSAVVVDNKAYAFIGDSGNGKSTLASAFLQRGFRLLSDDVIAVSLGEGNIPYVTPAYPQQKLWQESLDFFGMQADQFRPVFDRETKFAIPVRSQFSTEALPLAGVFELVKTDSAEVELKPIQKLERLHLLYRHTYRNYLLANSGLTEWHFHTTTSIVNKIDCFQLRRPVTEFTAHQLSSLILSAIGKE
ncbi:aldolase [Paenibacillus sp. SI8]|uniref:aldolase n=1 Tax=unclassified Paenibacillus TaxID=185978 RepID=UPI003466FBDD